MYQIIQMIQSGQMIMSRTENLLKFGKCHMNEQQERLAEFLQKLVNVNVVFIHFQRLHRDSGHSHRSPVPDIRIRAQACKQVRLPLLHEEVQEVWHKDLWKI